MGNVFVSVGNTEVSNKMTPNLTDQKVSVTGTFCCSDGSCAAVERQYCHEFLFVRKVRQGRQHQEVQDKVCDRSGFSLS